MDFVFQMPVRKAINFYNFAVEQSINEIKIQLSPFLEKNHLEKEETNHYFEDDRSREEILKGVENIINGNI